MKKKPNTRKDKRKDDTDTTTGTAAPPRAPTSPISGEPSTIDSKREKLIGASPSAEPAESTGEEKSASAVVPGPSVETKAFKDDPEAFLESNYVTFAGINYGTLPGSNSDLLFQMKSQQPHPTDWKKDDLFVVTHDRRYALDFEVATINPQYAGTTPLVLAIHDKAPDTGVRFLKWQEYRLTAMFLDADATWVFTGPLQGCHVYAAELEGGDEVLLHVNANEAPDEEENERVKDAKVDTFLTPMGGRVTHRLTRRDYAPETRIPYNGFVFGRKSSDKTWEFFVYAITLDEAGRPTGRRLQALPAAR